MKALSIPVRVTGSGSQPVDDDVPSVLALPDEVRAFRMPSVPEAADGDALARARDVLAAYLGALEGWNPAKSPNGPTLDMRTFPPDVVGTVNQMLGEGEVSVVVSAARAARMQESVFTGLWRVYEFDAAGELAADRLEAAAIPSLALEVARAQATDSIGDVEIPAGAMNAPALLAEIAAQMKTRRPHDAAHIVNLTLFPLTADDHSLLERALPVGPVAMISRGFGNCRITSTLARNVWRVQYFNNMNTLILNTIEVVGVPEVALAAPEDLEDSRARLAELVEWIGESCPA